MRPQFLFVDMDREDTAAMDGLIVSVKLNVIDLGT